MMHKPPRCVSSNPHSIELRGPSGRLYGVLDMQTMVIEFKQGREREAIDLAPYFAAAKVKKEEYQGS